MELPPPPPTTAKELIALHGAAIGSCPAILENVDLQIKPGSRLLLMGRNGSGRSALLSALAGKLKCSIGTRTVGERWLQLLHWDQSARDLPAEEDETPTDFILRLAGSSAAGEESTVLAMLNDVGIDRFAARRPVGCLSSGERTLTALTALCFAPKHLLLLDEPFAFLGAAAVERLAEALSPARWQGTLVYTTTSRAAAESLQPSCFAVVGKGRVVLHDRPPCDADWRAVHEAEIEEAVHASREDEHQDEAAGATKEAKRQKVAGSSPVRQVEQ